MKESKLGDRELGIVKVPGFKNKFFFRGEVFLSPDFIFDPVTGEMEPVVNMEFLTDNHTPEDAVIEVVISRPIDGIIRADD